MNRNQLKIIACISMFIDHFGFILYPNAGIFHQLGRIAMPIFAFFIAEGCIYTRNRLKYFLRIFILGLICQAVYIAESLISGSDTGAYLNILLTFSVSVILCSSFIYAQKSLEKEAVLDKIKGILVFLISLLSVITIDFLCKKSFSLTGISIEFDYGLYGMVLPLFALIFKDKKLKLLPFIFAQIFFAFRFYEDITLTLCSFIPLLLLMLYNGENGKRDLKYFFYAFYPCHLGFIYLLSYII